MTHIGGYELVEQAPSTEPVLKAFDEASGRFVALKQAPGVDQDKLRFDAMILGMLDHPNIARIFDTVSEDGLVYLVQEWVDGTDLGSIRDHAGALTVAQSVTAVRGALRGLAFAHNRQIVHGEVSPRHILVSTAGDAKLIDFGAVAPEAPGAIRYRSPEVLAGSPATKRSDVYSAAAVLADLLGMRPRRASFDLAGIDRAIVGVLSLALSADPEVRPAAGAQLLEDLEAAADRSLGLGWPADTLPGLVVDTLDSRGAAATESSARNSAAVAGSAKPAAPMELTVTTRRKHLRRLLASLGAAVLVLLALAAALITHL